MRRTLRSLGLCIAVCLVLVAGARAGELKPGVPFTDNAVLQRDVAVPVWGTAEAGEKITVSIGQQKKTATADKDGKWTVKLDALSAGGPFELAIEGKTKITLSGVMAGEVWLCSGQSNMAMKVSLAANAAEEVAAADFPQIRLLSGTGAPWAACSPQTVGSFSAAAYYFGRELHKTLKVPVGLINESVGGTSAVLWTPFDAVKAVPDLKRIVDSNDKMTADFPKLMADYEEKLKKWNETKEGIEPRKPRFRPPGVLYDTMIQPVAPFAIRGAIWYQGEADAGRPAEYGVLFPTMIKAWRKAWGQGEFPFLFVQLPNYAGINYTGVREAQAESLSVPNTGMAVAIDIGDAKNIHPKNKQDVGRRLALIALAKTYGQKVVYSGPVYDKFTIEDGKVRIQFKEIAGGLEVKGDELKGFTIAGEDKRFVPAQAKIDNGAVVVWSGLVPKPAAVRYGWEANPTCNLYNKEGLPAAPFRTDDW